VFAGGIGNPPLGQLWIAAPGALAGVDYTLFGDGGLLVFRLPVIALGLVAGLVSYRLARDLFTPAAALATLFFFATSPTFIAHASLATLDVPLAAVAVLGVWLARRASSRRRLRDFGLLGLALGAAVSVKVQGLLLLPIVALQCALGRERRGECTVASTIVGTLTGPALALLLAWVLLFAVYGTLPLSGRNGLLPADFVRATLAKLAHSERGHLAYLMGEWSTHGWWSYFPIALALKTPVPMWSSAIIGMLALRRSVVAWSWLGVPFLFFFLAAVVGGVDIGIRHILPALPFLFGFAGFGLALAWRRARPVALALLALQLGDALWNAPHELAYFNALAGGSRGGAKVLLDSNFDWGQHDPALRAYLDARAPGDVAIDPDPYTPRAGTIAVGASALHGILGGGARAYRWLRARAPRARVAETWLVYEIAPEDVPGASEATDPKLRPERIALARHVLRAAQGEAARRDVRVGLALVQACWDVYEYDCALEAARRLLRADPGQRAAFWAASEITARRRMGVLHFVGREYLDGFARLEPAQSFLPDGALAGAARHYGASRSLAALHEALGDWHWRRSEWTAALLELQRASALRPRAPAPAYKLAWLLATHPDARWRDGRRALELARAAGDALGWKGAAAFDAEAAALAELGRFDEAVEAAAAARRRAGGRLRDEVAARERAYALGHPHRLERVRPASP